MFGIPYINPLIFKYKNLTLKPNHSDPINNNFIEFTKKSFSSEIEPFLDILSFTEYCYIKVVNFRDEYQNESSINSFFLRIIN